MVHGIGGTGKTTLAAEITTRVLDRDPGRILVSLTGPLTLESLLGAVTSAIRRELLVRGGQDSAAHPGPGCRRAGRPGLAGSAGDPARATSWTTCRCWCCWTTSKTTSTPTGPGMRSAMRCWPGCWPRWVADPGASRLLVTSRYPFTLPGGAERALSFRQLGALSRAETMKLAWSLPALDKLDEGQLEQVWRLAGGHPRSLEYLDALLSGGDARYPDVTARLTPPSAGRLSGADRGQWLAARTGLDAALAETVALAADDVLLDDLLTRLAEVPGAAGLLLGVSVYREPVDHNAVLFQAGQPDPAAENIPDRRGASQQITGILAAAGITVDESLDLASCPGRCAGAAGTAPGRAEPAAGPAVPAGARPAGAGRRLPGGQPAHRQRRGRATAVFRAPVDRHRAGRAGRPRARPAAGRGAPAGGRLLAVAGRGMAAGQGRGRA